MTLSRGQMKIRHWGVWILVLEINIIEDFPRIQQQWHRCAFGSSGLHLSVSDDFCKFIIRSFIIRHGMRPVSSLDLAEDLVQLLLWSSAESGQMMKLVQLRNLLKHQRKSRNQ